MSAILSPRNTVDLSLKWQVDRDMQQMLGQCNVYSLVLSTTPIDPKFYNATLEAAIINGAYATGKLDGNTLTKDEINLIRAGEQLRPEKAHLEAEVRNVFEAIHQLLEKKIIDKKRQWVTPNVLKRLHLLVGKNLGGTFGEAGGFDKPQEEIESFCSLLCSSFHDEQGRMPVVDAIVMAIVAHVQIALMKPFEKGNGRVARLAELYICARGGLPDLVLTTLSNHYLETRKEYERLLYVCKEKGDITEFLRYAITGLRDGMAHTLADVQHGQLGSAWREYIFRVFNDTDYSHKEVLKRRRNLALEFPLDKKLSMKEIGMQSIKLAHMYSGISEKTLSRDIEELEKLGILTYERGRYYADVSRLNPMMSRRMPGNGPSTPEELN